MGWLDGTVAIITGAASGIGRGIARRYVKEGARICAVDISGEQLAALAAELGSAVKPIVADVSRYEDNCVAVEAAISTFGRLNVFVGNAGIYDHAIAISSLTGRELSAGFDEIFGVNVKGYLLGVRAALSALYESKGSIILTASFASFSPSGGGCLYTASKHAVAGLIRQLAYELAPDIRVNGIAPGIAPTTLRGIDALGQEPKYSVLEGVERLLPTQAVPTADSYGGLYAFLAAPRECEFMTGSIITADSGLAIRGLARPAGGMARPLDQGIPQ
jgi:NAD(P)-dependent dehydrogenase (short-subunit alcohol dehydrogenase family)